MQKQPLQDVIVKQRTPPSREGLVRPPQRRDEARRLPPVGRAAQPSSDVFHPERPRPIEPAGHSYGQERKRTRWLAIALGIGALVLAVSFGLSLMFAGATVTVYPREQATVIHGTFTAQSGAAAAGLTYELMTVERTATKEVPAEAERLTEERASGKATIFNEFSERPQRLIKNTRFASPDGKIYRIRESVEVPGGTETKPGTIEVTVVAEEAGEAYNRGPTEFSIPGLEGLPQSGKVYARAVGDITGGFSGMRRQVSDEARTAARAELEAQLKEELMTAAFSESNKPVGQYLYKEAVFFEYIEAPDELVGDTSVRITLVGRLHGVLFPSDTFDRFLARETVSGYDGNAVHVMNPENLQVIVGAAERSGLEELGASSTPNTLGTEPWKANTLSVTVRGDARFVWHYDEAMLARDLAGKDKSRMNEPPQTSILSGYPGIDRAQASIRPFWKSTFPKDPENIRIVTKLDS